MGRNYIDSRGWKYQVMCGLGESNYKARYQKPEKRGDIGWKGLASVPWRKSFEETAECLGILTSWSRNREEGQIFHTRCTLSSVRVAKEPVLYSLWFDFLKQLIKPDVYIWKMNKF